MDNLESIYGGNFTISGNKNLKSLKGLNNLTSIIHPNGNSRAIEIFENPKLSEYCAIKKIVSNSDNKFYLITTNNLYNPTIEDIKKNCN